MHWPLPVKSPRVGEEVDNNEEQETKNIASELRYEDGEMDERG
jgi:hypothetical protein